ncbi:helicase associated domain-containing protein [Streptomyces sp. NBC_01207]|uniref:helicase associated domain-containing protein n=1 Tax=Streptomyces sp. NBC_01207 TaxID=2903772 RepID=UPI002E15B71D|nr:helicase associated domain-containing protein [Streptomyces sp. NBC_01207]WTA23905.1 helicase associated domain-containing protein [Streptomyces sp. NBC_00853]
MTRRGEDVGRWLATQRRNWDRLGKEEQQRRLGELGVRLGVRLSKTRSRRDRSKKGLGKMLLGSIDPFQFPNNTVAPPTPLM